LINKVRKYIFAFRQLSDILNFNEIQAAYYAYVQSILSYGILSWGGAYISHINRLNITQKAILKAGFKKCKRYPTDLLFKETQILPVHKLYIKDLFVYIFKHFGSIFSPISHSHNTRYASKTGINAIQQHKSFSKTNCFYNAHILYRNYSSHFNESQLFNSNSVNIFKRKIKEWLLLISNEEAESLILVDFRRPATN